MSNCESLPGNFNHGKTFRDKKTNHSLYNWLEMEKDPVRRIWTTDLRITACHTTVLRSTNWATTGCTSPIIRHHLYTHINKPLINGCDNQISTSATFQKSTSKGKQLWCQACVPLEAIHKYFYSSYTLWSVNVTFLILCQISDHLSAHNVCLNRIYLLVLI